jgi:hypothetical protein
VFTKLVALNYGVTSGSPSVIQLQLTMNVPCSSNAAPYELVSGVWTPISYTNPNSCQIAFSAPIDPVIGVFTWSAQSFSGNGGTTNYGSGSTGSGGMTGGGAGGPSGPSLTQFTHKGMTCYVISNFTNPNSEILELNGSSFSVVLSSIGPSSAALIINGKTYVLSANTPMSIGSTTDFNYTANVVGISFLPILHTITADICSTPVKAAPPVNVTSTTTIPPTTTTVSVSTTTIPKIANVTNTTTIPSKPPAPLPVAVPAAVGIAVAIALGLTYYGLRRRRNRQF